MDTVVTLPRAAQAQTPARTQRTHAALHAYDHTRCMHMITRALSRTQRLSHADTLWCGSGRCQRTSTSTIVVNAECGWPLAVGPDPALLPLAKRLERPMRRGGPGHSTLVEDVSHAGFVSRPLVSRSAAGLAEASVAGRLDPDWLLRGASRRPLISSMER